jgi:hypothetical protein
MKRLIFGMGLGLGLALSPGESVAQLTECDVPNFGGCNALCIQLNPNIGWAIDIPLTSSIACSGGNQVSLTTIQAILNSGGGFGPDCIIAFSNSSTGAVALVQMQQDFCFLEAGAIHVSPSQGPTPQFTTQDGSYADSLGGLVTINDFDASACLGCDADRPTGKVSRIGTDNGSVKFSGRFSVPGPLDLSAASVTLQRVLHEFRGAGELLTDGSGSPIGPLTLVARRGSSTRSAIFESPVGQRPAVRLELKKKGEELDVSLRVDRATIRPPALCDGGDEPQTDLYNVGLSIDDGANPPVSLVPLHRWACRIDKTGAVTELKLVDSLLSASPATP